MPSPGELSSMKQDLDFKEGEMQKSKTTASGLAEGTKFVHFLKKYRWVPLKPYSG